MKRSAYEGLRKLIVQVLKHGKMRTTMLTLRLITYHKQELRKLGFSLDAYFLQDKVLRQLHNLKERNVVIEKLSFGKPGEGRNYTWAFWRLAPRWYEVEQK